jgi:ATP-binding cassette, subfamily B, bacterial
MPNDQQANLPLSRRVLAWLGVMLRRTIGTRPFQPGPVHLTQMEQMGCGPTCLRMVAASFGRPVDTALALHLVPMSRIGVSIADIVDGGRALGIAVKPMWMQPDALDELADPAILLWRQSHFVVFWGKRGARFLISDPAASGQLLISRSEMQKYWVIDEDEMGIALCCKDLGHTVVQVHPDRTTAGRPSRALLGYLTRQKQDLFALSALYLAIAGVTAGFPILILTVFRFYSNGTGVAETSPYLVSVVFLLVAKFGLEYLRSRTLLRISANSAHDMLGDFLARVFGYSILQFSRLRFGDYVMKLTAHERIQMQVKSTSFYVVFDLVALLGVGLMLAFIHPFVALSYTASLVLIVISSLYGMTRARLLRFQGYNVLAVTRTIETDILRGMQDIKAAGQEAEFRFRWLDQIRDGHQVDARLISLRELQQSFARLVLGLSTVVAIVIMSLAIAAGTAAVGEMLFVVIVLGIASGPAQQLAEFVRSLDDLIFYFRQLADIHHTMGPADRQAVAKIECGQESATQDTTLLLDASGIGFSYATQGRRPTLRDITLQLRTGSIFVLFGASGSGKSTLAKVLAGLYPPSTGEVSLYDTSNNAKDPTIRSVFQESQLFSLSVQENIAFGVPETQVDVARLADAVRLAGLEMVIQRLPMRMNTMLGAAGYPVSGGERQRILIARALYDKPDILVLDESTNGLDKETEARIITDIRKSRPLITLVLVSHSPAIARMADRIFVIHDGEVCATGNHKTLIRDSEHYATLLQIEPDLQSAAGDVSLGSTGRPELSSQLRGP